MPRKKQYTSASIDFACVISSPKPLFDHLLGMSQDIFQTSGQTKDFIKKYPVGIIEIKMHTLSGALQLIFLFIVYVYIHPSLSYIRKNSIIQPFIFI